MRPIHTIYLIVFLLTAKNATGQSQEELFELLRAKDSLLFEIGFNQCDLAQSGALLTEDLEFYHDQGGLSLSKSGILESIEKNICGKGRRELVPESVEVHEIRGFGAVEIGLHKFYNSEAPNAVSKPSRFVTVWKEGSNGWKMHRIISLH